MDGMLTFSTISKADCHYPTANPRAASCIGFDSQNRVRLLRWTKIARTSFHRHLLVLSNARCDPFCHQRNPGEIPICASLEKSLRSAKMDPAQSECYATAQVQLRELFHEISKRGFVGAAELQHSLLPFAAGDVRRDVLELIDDLTRRRAALDEHEFIRAMWRKMYLPHMLFAAKLSGCRENNVERGSSGEMVNVPFAHVVVTIKRRGQMKQFASYYKSRGISGADHLTSVSAMDATSPSPGKQNLRISSPKQATIDPAEKASTPSNLSVEDLRHRRSACYDVVVCVYDGADRALKTSVIRAR